METLSLGCSSVVVHQIMRRTRIATPHICFICTYFRSQRHFQVVRGQRVARVEDDWSGKNELKER